MRLFGRRLYEYFPGVLIFIGLLFPITGTVIEIQPSDLQFSISSVISLHQSEPILWLLDLIPLFFLMVAGHITNITRYLHERSDELSEYMREQSQTLENELSFFEALIKNSPFAIVQLDTYHRIISYNPAFEELFGFDGCDIVGRNVDDLVVPSEYYQEGAGLTENVMSGKIIKKITRRKKKNGQLFDVEIIGVPVFVGKENVGVLAIYLDISAQKQTEHELQLSENRFRSLFYDSPISLWEEDFSAVKELLDAVAEEEDVLKRLKNDTDLVKQCIGQVKILDVNQATVDLYQASSKENLLASLSEVFTEKSIVQFRNEMIALASGEHVFECEIEQRKQNDEVIYGLLHLSVAPGAEDTWNKVFISIVDITERKQAENELRHLSFHDALTGLYNRAYFEEEMARLEESRMFPVTIITCDLDNLKDINDNFGHDKGDQALRGAARVLLNAFRNEDVIARIGGDEFAVILPHVDHVIERSIQSRISGELERYNQLSVDKGLYWPISFSYGSATVPVGASLFEGYKQADEQMYYQKLGKRKKFQK